MDRIEIRRPDDWHLHLRDGAMLAAVVGDSAARFARAIIMPNLRPPVVSTADAAAYRERILAAVPPGAAFTPLMTAYLTEATDPDDLARGAAEGVPDGGQALPCRSDHQLGQRRDRPAPGARRVRADGADRPAAPDPRRGGRSGRSTSSTGR